MRLSRCAVVVLMMLIGTSTHAADEEPVCQSLLRQIGGAINRLSAAEDNVQQRAKYLERIALMERSALQSAYPSSAAVFDNELARANQNLESAQMRRQLAVSEMNMAMTTYAQQCPQHFASIQERYDQLAVLAIKALSDPEPQAPPK
jgi:hypothetical protein